jgi:hypothetical protein
MLQMYCNILASQHCCATVSYVQHRYKCSAVFLLLWHTYKRCYAIPSVMQVPIAYTMDCIDMQPKYMIFQTCFG